MLQLILESKHTHDSEKTKKTYFTGMLHLLSA